MTSSLKGQAGFTLLEVILGVMIMALLAGASYRIVESVAQAATVIERSQARRENVAAFVDTLRWTFRRMPMQTRLGFVKPPQDVGAPDLMIREDPSPPFVSAAIRPEVGVVLRVEPQGVGLLRIARYLTVPAPPEVLEPPVDDSTRLVLLNDLSQVSWSIFRPEMDEWQETMPEDGSRARVIRLTIRLAEESVERAFIFSIAPQVRRQEQTVTQ